MSDTDDYKAKITACVDLLLLRTEVHCDNFPVRMTAVAMDAPWLAFDGPLTFDGDPWRKTFACAALALGVARQPLPPLLRDHRDAHGAGLEIRAEIYKRLGEAAEPPDPKPMHALFFDDRGCGPDGVELTSKAFEIGGGLEPVVGITAKTTFSPFGMHVGGGYGLDVAGAEKLVGELTASIAEAKRLSGKVSS